MSVGSDFKHLRRSADREFMPKKERLALLGCIVITVAGTLGFLMILADSL